MNQLNSIYTLKKVTALFLLWCGILNITIAQIAVDFEINAPSCNGYTNGSATASSDGGEAPYSYLWEDGTVGETINGLRAGTYQVTVTDGAGEEEVMSVNITEPDALAANIRNSGDVCAGTASSLVAEVSGGTAPYTYEWSNGDTDLQSSSLIIGTNTLTVTDANGCEAVATVNVSEAFQIETETYDVFCTEFCDGVVKVALNGGTAPYDIIWSTGATNTASIDWLSPGEYSVTVTDANGCEQTQTATVGEPAEIELNLSVANLCDPAITNVAASVTPMGGTGSYEITWSNGTEGPIVNNLMRGETYTVVVKDSLGCPAQTEFTVPNTTELMLNISATNTTCGNDSNGSASVNAAGGTGFTYAWSNGATTASIDNLSPATYTVTVTASNGCDATESVTILASEGLSLSTTEINATCAGVDNGMANVAATGGSGEYAYEWEDGSTTSTINNLALGTYNVTVADANNLNCRSTTTVNIGTNTAIEIELTPNNPDCEAALGGSINATPTGGVAPYEYVWSNGATTASISDLAADTYALTVTDANNCTATTSSTLTEIVNITPVFSSAITSCEGDVLTVTFSDESTIEGQRAWSFSNGETSTENNYSITIPNGETVEATLTIGTSETCSGSTTDSVTAQTLTISTPDELTACKDDALQLAVTTENEIGEVTYSYEPASAFASDTDSANPTLVTTETGEMLVTVTVMDDRGCSASREVMVNITEEITGDPAAISTSQCEGLQVDFTNSNTDIEYTYDFGDDSENMESGENVSHEYAESGTYIIRLTPADPSLCAAPIEKEIVVTEPNIAAFGDDAELCSEDGEVTFTNESVVNVDDPIYAWTFSNGETSAEENPTITLTENGIVEASLTVSFGENCELTTDTTFELIIFNPEDIDVPDVMACRGAEVELNEAADPTLTYEFTDDGTLMNPDSNNPSTMIGEDDDEDRTYEVTITDETGQCEVTNEVNVTLPPRIETEVSEDVEQCGDTPVTLNANSEQAATITWFENGNAESAATGENYEISPTERETQINILFVDDFDCEVTETIIVRNNNPLVEVEQPEQSCGSTDEIELEIINLMEEDMLSYTWTPDMEEIIDDPTAPNPMVTPTETTTFVTTITNQLGCTIEEEVTVEVSSIEQFEVTAERDTVLAGESVNLNVNRNGELTYSWTPTEGVSDPTAPDPFLTPSTTTTYKVTVTDPNNPNCIAERDVPVTVLQSNCSDGFIYLPNAFTPDGDGLNDILFVRGYSITEMQLIIYNRWGQKVFESNSVDNGWNGTFNGEPVCSDVYGYYLEVRCFGGERFVDQGNITVLK